MELIPNTTRFHRGKLPHWEIQDGRYFVTVRLADSLPIRALNELRQTHIELCAVKIESEAWRAMQRKYFRTLEKYLDAGSGSCVLRQPEVAKIVAKELHDLAEWDVEVTHFTLMPNHLHGMIVPSSNCLQSLGEIMKRLKGRSAHQIRAVIGGAGPIWQREWFDRWMRDAAEEARTIEYIRQNPVTAGLVPRWEDHPWTR